MRAYIECAINSAVGYRGGAASCFAGTYLLSARGKCDPGRMSGDAVRHGTATACQHCLKYLRASRDGRQIGMWPPSETNGSCFCTLYMNSLLSVKAELVEKVSIVHIDILKHFCRGFEAAFRSIRKCETPAVYVHDALDKLWVDLLSHVVGDVSHRDIGS